MYAKNNVFSGVSQSVYRLLMTGKQNIPCSHLHLPKRYVTNMCRTLF